MIITNGYQNITAFSWCVVKSKSTHENMTFKLGNTLWISCKIWPVSTLQKCFKSASKVHLCLELCHVNSFKQRYTDWDTFVVCIVACVKCTNVIILLSCDYTVCAIKFVLNLSHFQPGDSIVPFYYCYNMSTEMGRDHWQLSISSSGY